MSATERGRPGIVEPAIGGLKRRTNDTCAGQRVLPAAITAQPRPAAAAQGKHDGLRGNLHLAIRRQHTMHKTDVRGSGWRRKEAQPTVPCVECHTVRAQSLQPRSQQRCCLEPHRENPTGAAHKRVEAELGYPGTGGRRIEPVQPSLHLILRGITGEKLCSWLSVGNVEPPDAGPQELAPRRGHRVNDVHGNAGIRNLLGCHKPGRARADDQHGHAGRQ